MDSCEREFGQTPLLLLANSLADLTFQGLVTATLKLNRRVIRERYAKEIQECFAAVE